MVSKWNLALKTWRLKAFQWGKWDLLQVKCSINREDGKAASSDPDQEEATDHYQAPGIWPVAKGQQQLAATDAVDGEEWGWTATAVVQSQLPGIAFAAAEKGAVEAAADAGIAWTAFGYIAAADSQSEGWTQAGEKSLAAAADSLKLAPAAADHLEVIWGSGLFCFIIMAIICISQWKKELREAIV